MRSSFFETEEEEDTQTQKRVNRGRSSQTRGRNDANRTRRDNRGGRNRRGGRGGSRDERGVERSAEAQEQKDTRSGGQQRRWVRVRCGGRNDPPLDVASIIEERPSNLKST